MARNSSEPDDRESDDLSSEDSFLFLDCMLGIAETLKPEEIRQLCQHFRLSATEINGVNVSRSPGLEVINKLRRSCVITRADISRLEEAVELLSLRDVGHYIADYKSKRRLPEYQLVSDGNLSGTNVRSRRTLGKRLGAFFLNKCGAIFDDVRDGSILFILRIPDIVSLHKLCEIIETEDFSREILEILLSEECVDQTTLRSDTFRVSSWNNSPQEITAQLLRSAAAIRAAPYQVKAESSATPSPRKPASEIPKQEAPSRPSPLAASTSATPKQSEQKQPTKRKLSEEREDEPSPLSSKAKVKKTRHEEEKKGSQFGIQTPPLLNYLQSILRGYSDGQILKELLQNAEDAGAREIQFLYDQHQYGTDHLLDPKLEKFQGPALCSFNDAVFKEEDWDAIQKPSQSGKKDNVLKVGRFGIGFSSVYHLTDLPCIMSRNYLAIIDPFQKYFEDQDGTRQSGSRWKLSEIIHTETYKHQLHPFREAFSNEGVLQGSVFPATFFRFPLRASPSKLCESVYTPEKIEKLLAAFKEDARIILLFLRKIDTVKIFRQESITLGQKQFLEVSIEQPFFEELRDRRNIFDSNLQKFKENPTTHCQNIAMTNTFNIVTKSVEGQTVENWVVHQEIALNCDKRLRELFERLNFLPWIGVAVPLFRKEGNSGRTFCFLPLPPGEESLYGLPVHVHGFFGVSDDRRSIKWPGGDQIQNEEAEWNKLLVDEVLPNVYLEALVKSTQVDDIDPNVVYAAFPDRRTNLGHWSTAVKSLYDSAFEHPMLYCQTKQTWMSLEEVVVVPNNHTQFPEQEQLLVSILEAHGSSVVTNLPDHIQYVINDISTAQLISPSIILECLREEQQREFSDEERFLLLDYLLGNECTAEDLEGLSLLPLDSGGFSRFSANPDSGEMVYTPTESCPQELLPNMPHRFLRRNLEGNLAEQLHNMCSSGAWGQLGQLDVSAVLDMLSQSLPELLRRSEDEIVTWQPAVTGTLDMKWLECLWTFLRREQVDLDKLIGLKVIPISTVSRGSIEMAAICHCSKIIRRPDDSEKTDDFVILESVLVELGAVFCTLPQYVAVHHQMSNSKYVYHCTPKDTLNLLQSIGQKEIERMCQTRIELRESMLSCLLPYLCGVSFSKEAESFIKKLTIFPQFQGERLLPLTDVHGMLNTETRSHLPSIRIPSIVCIHINNDSLYLLLKKLGVPESTSDTLLGRLLCDASENKYSSVEMETLLNWIQGRYEKIKMQPGVWENLRKIRFVPNIQKELRKPEELFDRSDDLVQRLAIDSKLLPSGDFFSVWHGILKDLGLKPLAELPSSQVIKIAENIRETKDTAQACALVEFLVEFPQCLSDDSLCDIVKHVAFLACRTKPPSAYPPNFPFWGKGNPLSKPAESFVYTDEMAYMVGASVPLIENLPNDHVVERLGIRRAPMVGDVMKQLGVCVSEQATNTSLWTMLQDIYNFLNAIIGQDADTASQILRGLPESWIYLGERFVGARKVYRAETSGTIDLRPFRSALPVHLKSYDKLLTAAEVPDQIDKNVDLLVGVLNEVKESQDIPSTDRVRVAMNILRRLADMAEMDQEDFRQRLLIPTNGASLAFLPPDEVCYCDADWLMQGNDADTVDFEDEDVPISFVHDDMSATLAEKLGVMPLSQRLAGADEIGGFAQTGQFEPLTVRLKNILRDGYQPEAIAKEMVQNAEDAGAKSVKFLLDLRSNSGSMKSLLDPEMAKVHGPALLVYNDAVFSKEDLQNITKLGGATKSRDRSKIGQFGLGFNAVYHITDVPSFVTTNFITFFDPHRSHLRRLIRGEGTGIQLNFVSNPSKIRKFRDQFQPYNGVFGCKILADETGPERFDGTIFRLPLRSDVSARTSDICGESYSEHNMKPLMKYICDSACKMILFTEHVSSISVYLFEDEASGACLLYDVNRISENINDGRGIANSFKVDVCDSMNRAVPMPDNMTSEMTFSCHWTERGKEYFQLSNDMHGSIRQTWVRVASGGKGRALELCNTDMGRDSGLLPCGGVAWSPTTDVNGDVYCFLPLSVPTSGLPVCINGAFAVASDRRSLWRMANSINNAASEFKAKWNHALCEDVIVCAYITLITQRAIKKHAEERELSCFFLWPNPAKTNSDCMKVMTGFYHTVVHGFEGGEPPKVFNTPRGVGRFLSIGEVVFGDHRVQTAGEMFLEFQTIVQEVTQKTVLELPDWVAKGFEEAGCGSTLQDRTLSWERFFREVFLPSFHLLGDCIIRKTVAFGLSLRNEEIGISLRESECIPCSGQGKPLYKKPSDLLDPKIFKRIFIEEEGVFPEPAFLRKLDQYQMATLRGIGCMKEDLDWPHVIERLKTIGILWGIDQTDARNRVAAMIRFISGKLSKFKTTKVPAEVKSEMETVAFLPAVKCTSSEEELRCSREVHPKENEILVGHVCYILTVDDMCPQVSQFLAIAHKEARPEDVIRNIQMIREKPGVPEEVNERWHLVYDYLQNHLGDPQVRSFIKSEKCFVVDGRFSEAGKLATESESIPPFLYRVPPSARKFVNLLETAGVKQIFGYFDYIEVLVSLKVNHESTALDDDMLKIVNTRLIKLLFDVASDIPDDLKPKIPLPDVNRVLHESGNLSFCDLDQFRHLLKDYTICHHEIPLPHAKSLGVCDIREQMLKNYEFHLPGSDVGIGVQFGQREELVNRIKRIMEGYPCDVSILKEIVQNADDANATKVHFVLDCREHPVERLFCDTMADLQGPALLAFNNKPFSDEDIIGIQKLGEGSKSNDSDKTGRYGVGFNVVYHLTDCPMFLSQANTLCIFDPTSGHLRGASALSPGRMFRPVDPIMRESYADLFDCFFSFEEQFSLGDGSLFRLPLRQSKTQLGDPVSAEEVEELLQDFETEIFDVLLFLKNVREISISIWKASESHPTPAYTVTAELSQRDKQAHESFFQNMSQQMNRPIADIKVRDLQYFTDIADSSGYRESWLIHQRLGIENKDEIPESVRLASTRMKLLPKGGIAARMNSTTDAQPQENEERRREQRKLRGKAFCFLPLPIETGLPVHLDGYFDLGHESRRNLWEAPEGDARSDWNHLLANSVIAPAYVLAVESIKDELTRSLENLNLAQLEEKLQHYHSFFPLSSQQECTTRKNTIQKVFHTFYAQIARNKHAMFPVVLTKCPRYKVSSNGPVFETEKEFVLLWKSCMTDGEDKGYFDNLQEQNAERCQDLRKVMLSLGFPIISTPVKIYKVMKDVIPSSNSTNLSMIHPMSVLSFLKTSAKETTLSHLPDMLKKTLISHKGNLRVVLSYVKRSDQFSLQGLPLLLTNDEMLQEFSEAKQVFYSEYCSLLPNCAHEFLHREHLDLLNRSDKCFRDLTVHDLVQRLSSHLTEDSFFDRERVQWDHGAKPMYPTKQWVSKLWSFLRTSAIEKSYMVQLFANWCIYPVTDQMEHFLIPMRLVKTVLSFDKLYSCHTGLRTVCRKLSVPVANGTDIAESHFMNEFGSDPRITDDMLCVLERVMHVDRDKFRDLGDDDHYMILENFNGEIEHSSNEQKDRIKRLPCFESRNGKHVSLLTTAYALTVHGIPEIEQEKWVNHCNYLLLNKARIPGKMIKALGINEINPVGLYDSFVLPHYATFSRQAQWEHLSKIMRMVLIDEEVIQQLSLSSRELIPNTDGTLVQASFFSDAKNPVFRELLDKKSFPPNHPKETERSWLQFLRQIGMTYKVSCGQFEEFLQKVSEEDRNQRREEILVEYLMSTHHLHEQAFLGRLVRIPFITAERVQQELTDLHEQCPEKRASLSAVSENHRNMVWTTELLLPEWVFHKIQGNCRQCNQTSTKFLPCSSVPTLPQVLFHTKTLFVSLSTEKTRYANPAGKALLRKIIIDILGFLCEQCVRNKETTCSDRDDCCETCEAIVEALENIPIVPTDDSELFKVKRMTRNLSKFENKKLLRYIKQLPDEIVQYSNLLYCMGATESPSHVQYAGILELFVQEIGPDVSKNSEALEAATQAMEGFFRQLSQVESVELKEMTKLYLLTRKGNICNSTQMFYNDIPEFRERLISSSYSLVKDLSGFDIEVQLPKLGRLGPKLISKNVREVSVDTDESHTLVGCKCLLSVHMERALNWPAFVRGLKCILSNQGQKDFTRYENTFRAIFKVVCLFSMQTELCTNDGDVIEGSRSEQGVMFKATDDNEVTLFLSHQADRSLIYIEIAEALASFAGIKVRDTKFLLAVLQATREERVMLGLSKLGLKIGDGELEDDVGEPSLGTDIEEDVVCLLSSNIQADLNPYEFVGYNIAHSLSEHFVYARVIRRVEHMDIQQSSHSYQSEFIINIGEEERKVNSIWLYKLERPEDPTSTPVDKRGCSSDIPQATNTTLELYQGAGNSGAGHQYERSRDETTTPGMNAEFDLSDMNKSKREVIELMESLWGEERSLRLSGLRRLMRRWHPDKHKEENRVFAVEISKHIQSEITRLENGVPSGVDTADDVSNWAEQNFNRRSRYRQNYRRRFQGRGNFGYWGHRGGSYRWNRGWSGRGYHPPPSFHHDNQEAFEWRRQAQTDWDLASSIHTNIQSRRYYQWQATLCLYAAEKSVKAAQLASGCCVNDTHGIVEAAHTLKHHLDLMLQVQLLAGIVQKTVHSSNSCPPPDIPHDVFSEQQAYEVLRLSQVILEKVNTYLEGT